MELRYEIEMSRVRPFVEDQRKSTGNTNTFVRMQTLPGQITPKAMGRVMSPDFRDRRGASGAITGAGVTRFS